MSWLFNVNNSNYDNDRDRDDIYMYVLYDIFLANFKRAYLYSHTLYDSYTLKNLKFQIITEFYYPSKDRVLNSQSGKSLPGSYSIYLLTHHTINKIHLSPIYLR